MQAAQRLHYNPAFDLALSEAKRKNLPLLVLFVLSDEMPDANARHYRFMLEGISGLAQELSDRKIPLRISCGKIFDIVSGLAPMADTLVMDHGYLALQRELRDSLFECRDLKECTLFEVDTEAVIPVHIASDKEEYSAATLRRKIIRLLPDWMDYDRPEHRRLPDGDYRGIDSNTFPGNAVHTEELFSWAQDKLKWPLTPAPVSTYRGGCKQAFALLKSFSEDKLRLYSLKRMHPEKDFQSELSPYLHFGQISPLEIMHRILGWHEIPRSNLGNLIQNRKELDGIHQSIGDFADELIVRRELSMNFCRFNPDYDKPACLPEWARKSLQEHSLDPREKHYTLSQLEAAETEDPYWNAATIQMISTGKMHNYMRMYWGKRILSWCDSPEDAYEILLYLNNKYELDGRDPNAYAGVAWCFGKHDRPWQTRPIYGAIRYMNDKGLNRKFDMQAYLHKVEYQRIQR